MSVDAELRARPRWTPGFIGEGPLGLEGVRREFYRLADYLSSPALDGVQFVDAGGAAGAAAGRAGDVFRRRAWRERVRGCTSMPGEYGSVVDGNAPFRGRILLQTRRSRRREC